MRVSKKDCIRWAVIILVAGLLGIAAWCMSSSMSCKWGCEALAVLGDVSAVLFGVFGIWLGMFYRPDVCDALKGKSGAELDRTASLIVSNSKRFEIIFRGMKVSALVLVFSMFMRISYHPLHETLATFQPLCCFYLKFAFFYLVEWSVFLQGYALLMSIVPMSEAHQKMKEAQADAELALSLK